MSVQKSNTGQRIGFSLDDILPPLQRRRFTFSEATIRTLFSVPVQLLPAAAGLYRIVELAHFYREAGTAYTVGGVGNLQIGIGPQIIGASFATGLLGVDGPMVEKLAPGNAVSVAYGDFQFGGGRLGGALSMSLSAADPTGGSGKVYLQLIWRDWPMLPLPW